MFPLKLMRCLRCSLVQLSATTPRDILYHDNYGFYSGVNERLQRELSDIVKDALGLCPTAQSWLDIGCNDGTLLSFVPDHIRTYGVDPVSKFRKLALRHANQVLTGYFNAKMVGDHKFDIITSIAMFYDLDDPNVFVDDVKHALADDGVWVIQQNDLLSMMRANAIDNISHEHVTYWSVTSLCNLLDRHDLEVVDVSTSDLNGGCIRTAVRHKTGDADRSLQDWIDRESEWLTPERFREFRHSSMAVLNELHDLLREIAIGGLQMIDVYGASNRGATIWQAANVRRFIKCTVERNPDKVGRWFAPIRSRIISEEEMRHNPPDYLLIGPWWFKDMFIERESDYLDQGGALIIPLPNVEVITR
jgi:SAM-dependent methyltransferase